MDIFIPTKSVKRPIDHYIKEQSIYIVHKKKNIYINCSSADEKVFNFSPNKRNAKIQKVDRTIC